MGAQGIKDGDPMSDQRLLRPNAKFSPKTVGVNFRKDAQKWRAYYSLYGHRFHIGFYDTKDQAIEARKFVESLYGMPKKGPRYKGDSAILTDREISFVELYSTKNNDLWAIIDSEDVDKVTGVHWSNNNGYAESGDMKNKQLLHRLVMGLGDASLVIDHLDHNKTNNRKQNLRICTYSQNMHNIAPKWNNTTGVKGVVWEKRSRSYEASITINQKRHHLGRFKSLEKATRARKDAEERFGVAF